MRGAALFVLLAFATVGIVHLAIIGTRFDRAWMKYAVYALDTLSICAAFALVPISRVDDVPQIMAFRAYGIYYLFPRWLWPASACPTRAMCIIGWWAAFSRVVGKMETTTS